MCQTAWRWSSGRQWRKARRKSSRPSCGRSLRIAIRWSSSPDSTATGTRRTLSGLDVVSDRRVRPDRRSRHSHRRNDVRRPDCREALRRGDAARVARASRSTVEATRDSAAAATAAYTRTRCPGAVQQPRCPARAIRARCSSACSATPAARRRRHAWRTSRRGRACSIL